MLTVDYATTRGPGRATASSTSGCGFGRHAYQAARLGAQVVAFDAGADEVRNVQDTFGAMAVAGELDRPIGPGGRRRRATPSGCPSPTASFDRVIASEVLEHIPDDEAAMAELARVLRPGGSMAVTVPRCGPEFVNWALSDEYHNVPGGHVRIYRQSQLVDRLQGTGLQAVGQPPRPRPPRPLLVAPLPGGPDQRQPSGGGHLPPAAGVGHREGPQGDPLRRPGAQPAGRQEPGRLSREARRRVTGRARVRPPVPPERGRRHEVDPRGARSDDRGPGDGHRPVHRGPAATRRHDPVVPGRPLRPVEPRRGGHGPHRGRPRRRGRPGLPVAGRHPAARRQLVQLLPDHRHRGRPARHQRVRLPGHRGLAPVRLDR